MPLLHSTLMDLDDREAQVRKTEAVLEGAHSPVNDFGGARHATALISGRTLAVVRRKAELLRAAEARVTDFLEAHAGREALADALLKGEASPPPSYVGLKTFLAARTHKLGNPVDADKSNFELFVSTFGLPSEHWAVLQLRALLNEATEWWATRTSQEARAGADSETIQRFVPVLQAVSGIQNHPILSEVYTLLGDRLAEGVLAKAEQLHTRDAQKAVASHVPQPESAKQAAEAIKEHLVSAVAAGAPPKHPAMENAKKLEVALRMEEKNRIAQKVFLFAESTRAKDENAAAAAAPSVPAVGPASEAADIIDREVSTAVAQGVLEADPRLKAAGDIAKALRDEDNTRKRLAAREARLGAAKARAAPP